MSKVAHITAIFGGYEHTCKPFIKQTGESDFICFTDNPNIESNGWIIDTNPYHDTNRSPIDNGLYVNSTKKEGRLKVLENRHTFNIAKYYKQAWKNIPRLQEYDVVIWLDGSIEITNSEVSEYMLELCPKYSIVSWHHEMRGGVLFHEAYCSYLPRYMNGSYLDQWQPYQDERMEGRGRGDHFGVWLTCFVAFNNKDIKVNDFLDRWYLQTLKYTTQDQVSFPKVVQDTKIVPYTFPDSRIKGDEPHTKCDMFIKHEHWK